jgi:diguanylate cyclase (GGDEF)-like protein
MPVLTKQEIKYLKNKKHITMCIDPNWMPFEKIENGKHIGLSADYFKIFQEFIGTDIKLIPTKSWEESLKFAQERKCDILSLAMSTPKRKKYFNFTKPYLKIPLVIATKLDTPFITDFSMLKGKSIAIPTGYAFVEVIKNRYPQINIVEVKNIDEGLKKVTHDEVYGYLGTLASIGYAFQKKFTGELKIAGKFDTTWNLGIAVRDDDPMLFGILQKAVKSVDTNTRQHILNNWLSIKYEKGVDYSLIWKTVMIFIVILLIILFFYMKLNILKNKIDKQKNEIELLSLTDPMTKLYNRRYFSQISKNFLSLAKREKTKLSLMMIDVDNFKNTNDTYGHKAGDNVLISLSSTLVKLSRKSDIVCRFGGEEFIILLPKTDAKGAFVIAQKIRQNIEKLNIKTDDAKYINSTVSIGLSEIDTDKDKTIEPSIKRADEALYEAKRDGKNKVCIKNIGENICLQD